MPSAAAAATKGAVEAVIALVVERVETVPAIELLVDLEVKVRVSVPLVDTTTFADDLSHFAAALLCGGFVGLFSRLGGCLALG